MFSIHHAGALVVLGLAAAANGQPDYCPEEPGNSFGFGSTTEMYIVVPSECSCTCGPSTALAYTGGDMIKTYCENGDRVRVLLEADLRSDAACGAAAATGLSAGIVYGDLTGNYPFAVVSSGVQICSPCWVGGSRYRYDGYLVGGAVAEGHVDCNCSTTVTASTVIHDFSQTGVPVCSRPIRNVTLILCNGEWHILTGFFRFCHGQFGTAGATYNSGTDTWAIPSLFAPCPGRMIPLTYTDASYDLDGDDRFSSADVAIAGTYIGYAPPSSHPLVDIDQDGTVEQEDIDVLTLLATQEFSSGLFGDINADGVVNCDDSTTGLSNGALIGDLDYAIGADLDLDGELTQVEIDAVTCAIIHPDVNDDGNVDQGDIDEYIDQLAGSGARDLNCDGNTNQDDLDLLIDIVAGGCP